MTATIASLARDYGAQPHEIIASLELPDGTTDATDITTLGWTEEEARNALDDLAALKAAQA